MKQRNNLWALFVFSVILVVAFSLAYAANKAPDKEILIHSKEVFTEFKEAPVPFSHEKHKEFKCTDCHHEYKDGKNVWQEGQEVKKCWACHKAKAEEKVVDLKKAYHDLCQKCHKKLKEENKKTGPITCKKCHPKPGASEKEDEKK